MRLARTLLAALVLGLGCAGERESAAPVARQSAVPDAALSDGTVAVVPATMSQDTGSAEAAVAVVRDYYAAIEERDYARAYGHWADQGRASGQSFDEFRRGFSETASVEVRIGEPGRIEPAAGSRYIEIPVEVRARTTSGAAQCFCGSYVLVRSVVPGATTAQRSWHLYSADLRPCAEGTGAERADPDGWAAANVVERFGKRMAGVPLLAPREALLREIRTRYGPLVTPTLLDAWLRDPGSAPGRQASSPWPDRIEVRGVQRTGADIYEVTGDVVYVTSVEVARGSGAAAREGVALTVVRGDDDLWRIAEYREVGGGSP